MINIQDHLKHQVGKSRLYYFTRKELSKIGASQFKSGDLIRVSKYCIHIEYGNYDRPSLCSWLEDWNLIKNLDCTPGCGTPYYIDDFKSR